MENAIDALHIATGVLIFVVALTVSITSFGNARKTSRAVLDMKDREYDYTYVEDNGSTERIVGIESIIPTIYKAYKENYKIEFSEDSFDEGIYRRKNNNGIDYEKIYSIDLQQETHSNEIESFLNAILYGKNGNETFFEAFQKNNPKIYLNEEGLYDKIERKRFKESLGVYYQEEVDGATETPDANKIKKRVIKYTLVK